MTTLAELLTPVVADLNHNDTLFNKSAISPVNHGDTRIELVKKGLLVIAQYFEFPAVVNYISTGEFTFFGNKGRHAQSACQPFGEELAYLLRLAPTRTGTHAKIGFVMAQNGWLHINHFEAENLIRKIISEKLF